VNEPPQSSASGAELEEFFDLSVDLLSIIGFDGHFRRVNASFERLLGYTKPELLSRSVLDILHADDVEPAREALAQLASGRDMVAFDARIVGADGSVRWLEWNTRTMPERAVIYSVGRDVTDRRRLVDQQAGLRRLATLVAREASPEAVFAAVGREVGEVLGVDATHLGRFDDGVVVSVAQWGRNQGVPVGAWYSLEGDSVSARVLRSGRPARMDSYDDAPGEIAASVREIGIRFSIGVPISVEGRPWGVMIATSKEQPFPADAEVRLQDFTELLATAIANATAHDRVRALAEEQAALRRVATVVAQEPPQAEVFAVVAEEIGRLLGVDSIQMVRYERERFRVCVASAGPITEFVPVGTRARLEGHNVSSLVFNTRGPVRIDDQDSWNGPLADRLAAAGVRSIVGVPITVEGRLWGTMMAFTHDAALPADAEPRLGQFTELMATAIANAEARGHTGRGGARSERGLRRSHRRGRRARRLFRGDVGPLRRRPPDRGRPDRQRRRRDRSALSAGRHQRHVRGAADGRDGAP
jgi:PAS domain S-box-containing protein